MSKIFKIEKGHPMPKINMDHKIFPFDEMEVGDSFFVKNKQIKVYSTLQNQPYMYRMTQQFRRFSGKNYVFSIQSDKTKKGVRVFRIF